MATNLKRHKRSVDALTQSDVKPVNYCRFNPFCNGRWTDDKLQQKRFEKLIVSVYAETHGTVREILDNPEYLSGIAKVVYDKLYPVTATKANLTQLPNQHGFSFCEYVAKRLTLLWKDGKLKAKGPRYDRNFKKRKKRKFVTTVLSVD